MNTAIMILVIMVSAGLMFGLILAIVNKKFSMEQNPLIHEVDEILPKGQCGACGYAGCMAYAEAVVLDPEVKPNLCVPGKEAVAKLVAELTGKVAEKMDPRAAHIKCAGSPDKAINAFNYSGIQDCIAANLVLDGPKGCKYGCIGFGNCVRSCPFGALTMGPNELPIVDMKKCTGCGACETACPKHVIEMLPLNAHVKVDCSSKDKGAVSRKLCKAACLGCGMCKRTCPYGAIVTEHNLAKVDTSICVEKCCDPVCIAKCPTGAIQLQVQ